MHRNSIVNCVTAVLVLHLCAVIATPYVVNWEEPDVTTTGRPLLGQKKCTYGPAYWCHNITQAKSCGAMKHCIKKVWEPMKLPADNDDVCKICKEMVKEARDQLLSNETQDELREVLEGSCNLIPLKAISKECRQFVDEFIPELIDALASRMDPEVVCAISGLCNSLRIDEMLGEMKDIDSDGNLILGSVSSRNRFDLSKDSCPKCSHFIGKWVAYFQGLTKEELMEKMLEICGHVGSYSDSCRAIVLKEFDAIYSHVQNEMNSQEMCGVVGLCNVVSIHPVRILSSSSSVRVWTAPVNDDELQCDFCKQLINYLRNWLTTNTTKEEFEKIIEGLCKQTGKYSQECLNLAREYSGPLYQLLIDECDPQDVCTRIGQCPNAGGKVKLLGSPSSTGPIWTLFSKNQNADEPKRLVPGEELIGQDEKNSHRPGFEYSMMQLVPGETVIGNDEANSINPAEKQKVGDVLPTCELCTFTVTKLIDMIGKNRSKEAIDEAVDSICYAIPKSYQDRCLTFMKEYGERVVEMILIEGSAHEICAALHLCLFRTQATQQPPKLVGNAYLPFDRYLPQPYVEDTLAKLRETYPAIHDHLQTAINNYNERNSEIREKPTCAICEFAITQITSRLSDNATEQEIKHAVEHACEYLPKTLQAECKGFVEQYGDIVIAYLAQSMDPKDICIELKLCDQLTSSDEVEDYPMTLKMSKCDLCIIISDYLSSFLDDPKVDNSIEKLIEKICPLLPKKYTSECTTMIEDYGPYLLSLLAQETDKGKACTQVQLCPGPAA